MLEGKDSIWIELANEDKVSYFNLPAGNYVFQIRKFLDLESVNRVSFSIKQDRSWLTYARNLADSNIHLRIQKKKHYSECYDTG